MDVRNSYVAKSIDGGLTFSLLNDIDDDDWVISACPSSSPQGMLSGDSIIVAQKKWSK